jgi:hypothetical protein
MSNDLISNNRGFGNWELEIYNPNKMFGPIEGYLIITKEHHTIYEDINLKKTLINIPSQNVAWIKLVKK